MYIGVIRRQVVRSVDSLLGAADADGDVRLRRVPSIDRSVEDASAV
jgi:hypothetical protein